MEEKIKNCPRKDCVAYNEKSENNCRHDNKSICTFDENCPAFELDN